MIYVFLISSLGVNVLLGWYIIRLLRKFMFISENLSDLYLITKSFKVFIKNLYSMENYHGEPMIQEMFLRISDVNNEIDSFREIFEYTLDQELEEELNAAEEIDEESLFHEST